MFKEKQRQMIKQQTKSDKYLQNNLNNHNNNHKIIIITIQQHSLH